MMKIYRKLLIQIFCILSLILSYTSICNDRLNNKYIGLGGFGNISGMGIELYSNIDLQKSSTWSRFQDSNNMLTDNLTASTPWALHLNTDLQFFFNLSADDYYKLQSFLKAINDKKEDLDDVLKQRDSVYNFYPKFHIGLHFTKRIFITDSDDFSLEQSFRLVNIELLNTSLNFYNVLKIIRNSDVIIKYVDDTKSLIDKVNKQENITEADISNILNHSITKAFSKGIISREELPNLPNVLANDNVQSKIILGKLKKNFLNTIIYHTFGDSIEFMGYSIGMKYRMNESLNFNTSVGIALLPIKILFPVKGESILNALKVEFKAGFGIDF
ncbi:MAG: hypothetical protein AAFO15_00535 [Pseudomonadota bacterium]